jgi:hypothetical protein
MVKGYQDLIAELYEKKAVGGGRRVVGSGQGAAKLDTSVS